MSNVVNFAAYRAKKKPNSKPYQGPTLVNWNIAANDGLVQLKIVEGETVRFSLVISADDARGIGKFLHEQGSLAARQAGSR